MATITTKLFDPPILQPIVDERRRIERSLQNWLFSVQNRQQLKLVDTTAGSYAENVPAAGLNSSTGQSNQDQELVYKKISSDGHTFTLNGVVDGVQTLTAQWAKLRIRSDGTNWYVV